MTVSGVRYGRVFLKFILLAIVVTFFLAPLLFPGPSSETTPRTGPVPSVSNNKDVSPEPGTMLLFGSGILALGFLWKANS